MIYLIHNTDCVLEVLDNEFKVLDMETSGSITETLYYLSQKFPDELLIWCFNEFKTSINTSELKSIFHHKGILASYSVSDQDYISEAIGYVDHSIYIKIRRDVRYPTWLMSSDIGGVHASVLNKFLTDLKKDNNFDYFLNSLAKLAMPQGLFCYSDPNLLNGEQKSSNRKRISTFQLFRFVRQHYKISWIFFLLVCCLIYEKKFRLIPFINAIRYKKRKLNLDFDRIDIKSSKEVIIKREVDVIIPTLGRKKYLFDVLRDLSNQTLLPKNVIVVEQNPDLNSESELDYLKKQDWPFNIKHFFIHELGVCNARNLALENVESEWTFFGDDDIRFNENLLCDALESIEKYGVKTVNMVCLQPKEKQAYFKSSQTPIFGSGTSVVCSSLFDYIKFDLAFEFGFGEDSDFGMQIRNQGEDVMFNSNIIITHLKAPIGGFRTKNVKKWEQDKILPKPSPTISLFNQKYLSKWQILGYKLFLFLDYYRAQDIRNPIKYYNRYQKQWQSSIYWSNQLKQNA